MKRVPILLVAGWSLLALAWAMANPPFAAPDEGAHYLRTLGVSGGSLSGRPARAVPQQATPQEQRYADMTTRDEVFPGKLAPGDPGCYVLNPRLPATCIDVPRPLSGTARSASYVGDYQPLPYLLPAAVVRAADDANAAVRLGRLASMVPALLALALAAALLWDRRSGAVSLLGLVAAVTPMAIFCAASLTGSGLEISAGIAFAAALLRVWRDGGAPPGWVWGVMGASGAVLSLSRSASPAWVIADLGLFVAIFGVRRSGALIRRARGARAALGAIVAAVVLNRVWESLYGPDATISLANGKMGLRQGWDQLAGGLEQLVIGFGYLEFRPPTWLWLAWLAILLALVAGALAAGAARERLIVGASAAIAPFVALVLFVVVIRHTGYGLQGRHVLPLLVVLPLLAGEVLRTRRERLRAGLVRALVIGVPVVAAAAQLATWWLNARRAATGVAHGWWFIGDAAWDPPLGWWAWVAVATAGAVLVAGAGAGLRVTAGEPNTRR